MSKLRGPIMGILLIIASCLLPGSDADCDMEDGEFSIDIEDFFCGGCGGCGGCDHHDDCDDGWFFDFEWECDD